MSLKTKYKHIYFRDMSHYYPRRKTLTYLCINKSEIVLGRVAWRSGWRRYAFTPCRVEKLIFSAGCLDDISHFIKQLMEVR